MTRKVLKMFLATSALYLGVAADPIAAAQAKTGGKAGQQEIERGCYLVKIAGCDDCHTRATDLETVPSQLSRRRS